MQHGKPFRLLNTSSHSFRHYDGEYRQTLIMEVGAASLANPRCFVQVQPRNMARSLSPRAFGSWFGAPTHPHMRLRQERPAELPVRWGYLATRSFTPAGTSRFQRCLPPFANNLEVEAIYMSRDAINERCLLMYSSLFCPIFVLGANQDDVPAPAFGNRDRARLRSSGFGIIPER